ncbi:dihydropteroate synthase [Streptomyces goshikiensis]|uniref:dihydropteroate synthase n=1 Tax=Streptomyces goshikiensis TaxID=1942 RepID=UPI00365D103B
MGVVNVTPDSFADGGHRFDPAVALKHGVDLAAEGADLVDVGGRSTPRGAARVHEREELRRVIPVVRGLAAEGVLVSVDTMRASVAEQAIDAGAVLVNDVSGGLADPGMLTAVAAGGVPFVVSRGRGSSRDTSRGAAHGDVVGEVVAELRARMDSVVSAGILPERLVIDPGLGCARPAQHDLRLVAGLADLRALGRPVLVSGSRKRFLGQVLTGTAGTPPPADGRDAATAALSAIAAYLGAWAVRVHDVRATADAVRVAHAVTGAW